MSDAMTDDELAQVLWDYHHVNQPLEKADCMIVMGSHDLRSADWAAQLFQQGYAPLVIASGGLGRHTEGVFTTSEAELLTTRMVSQGVPKEKILLEPTSTNTAENITNSKKILAEQGIDPSMLILVHKPYMERRASATFQKVWPEKTCIVTSPPIAFAEYPTPDFPKEKVIAILVGDLQRLQYYGELGYQVLEEIPSHIWEAYKELIQRGYTSELLN